MIHIKSGKTPTRNTTTASQVKQAAPLPSETPRYAAKNPLN
jgi:hypothetical protein